MAESPAQRNRDEAAHRPGRAPMPSPAGLLAFTRDESLIEALRATMDAQHQVSIVTTDGALSDHLLASLTRAVLIDSAASHFPVAQLTARLKAQFPDLVLVVAGTVADQGALASQITDGSVFRFLHKPVSTQRVKLFVESAFRRSDTAPAAIAAATPTPPVRTPSGPRSRTPLVLAAVVAAIAVAGGLWLANRDATPTAATSRATRPVAEAAGRAPAPAELDPETLGVLERADAALARGSLVAPPGDSAADLYRQALAREPGSARAGAGLDTAEQALVAERPDDAARLVDFARGLRPDQPRVAFLAAQVAKERERQLLATARRAAAGGDLDRAIAVLESGSSTGSELLGAAKRDLQQREIEKEAANFLALADARLKSGALLEPAQDNARFYLESARALMPQGAALQPVERALRAALVDAANGAIATSDLAAAERLIAAGGESGVSREDLAGLRRTLEAARIEGKARALTSLSQAFAERLRQNRLSSRPTTAHDRSTCGCARPIRSIHPPSRRATPSAGK